MIECNPTCQKYNEITKNIICNKEGQPQDKLISMLESLAECRENCAKINVNIIKK